MARRREREINIFNIAFLDVITGAMGAFVLLVVLLSPYVKNKSPTEPTTQEGLGRTEQAIEQAEQQIDQAEQGARAEDVELLKRLLAQARAALEEARQRLAALEQELRQTRAALAEARQELAATKQELQQTRQELQQARAENEDLKKRLNRAIAAADEARQQVASLQITLSKSAPATNFWAMVDVVELPICGSINLIPIVVPTTTNPPPGLSSNGGKAYLNRNLDAVGFVPISGANPPRHWQFYLSFSTDLVSRYLFGIQAAPNSPPPAGCEVQFQTSRSALNTSGHVAMAKNEGRNAAWSDLRPLLLVAFTGSTD
jgi:hypothetical protein